VTVISSPRALEGAYVGAAFREQTPPSPRAALLHTRQLSSQYGCFLVHANDANIDSPTLSGRALARPNSRSPDLFVQSPGLRNNLRVRARPEAPSTRRAPQALRPLTLSLPLPSRSPDLFVQSPGPSRQPCGSTPDPKRVGQRRAPPKNLSSPLLPISRSLCSIPRPLATTSGSTPDPKRVGCRVRIASAFDARRRRLRRCGAKRYRTAVVPARERCRWPKTKQIARVCGEAFVAAEAIRCCD
jgi:hypothetical protein